jgi:hypothetical protein
VASTHTFPLSASAKSNHAPSPIADRYTRSVLQTHRSNVRALLSTFSAIHRLKPLLVVIRALLQYMRARARAESAAIAARERARTNTISDTRVIECLGEIACWHVAPELRLEELDALATEWSERGERGMRDLARLADMIEGRLRRV